MKLRRSLFLDLVRQRDVEEISTTSGKQRSISRRRSGHSRSGSLQQGQQTFG
jgi:hypothetical protein